MRGEIVSRGVAAGPEVARILRAVEDRWIAEGFPPRERVEALQYLARRDLTPKLSALELQQELVEAERSFTYRQAYDVAAGRFIALADSTMRGSSTCSASIGRNAFFTSFPSRSINFTNGSPPSRDMGAENSM